MKKLILSILFVLSAIAQTATNPVNIGNSGIIFWNPNAPDEGVIAYKVYVAGTYKGTTTTTNYPISSLLSGNGTYGISISAVNGAAIEGPQSTNYYVKYFANKPTAPGGIGSK